MKSGFQLLALITFFVLTTNGIQAQWNTNTSVNIQIASVPIADMESVPTTDGKTWIAFYHQNGGNYDMRAQLIDANGYKLLGTDGMLVNNNISGSATYVFNACVDASNNLIIAMQDQRSGPLSAVVYKISQAGTQLWGANGIVLGTGLAPYPAALSNGEAVIAWVDNTIKIQKITTGGTAAWGTPVSVTVGTSNTTRGQLIANNSGYFTLVFQKSGTGISTTLYAQRFDNNGTSQYSPVQICNQTTSAARYYSIAAEGDVTYFGYYASVGFRFNSFLQRINADGSMPYGINGANFNTATGGSDSYQMETRIGLAAGSQYVWSVCTFSDPNQVIYGVYVQKFLKTDGTRQFTDAAKVVYAISASTDQAAGNLSLPLISDSPMFMSYDNTGKIYATRLDASGNFVWPGNRVELSSTTNSTKYRYGFTPDGPNRCAGSWVETRASTQLGYAQGISIGGLIGVIVNTQGSVPAVITTPGGTLQMVATVLPASANQSVTWSIVPGTGMASITTGGLVTAITNGTVWAKAIAVQDVSVMDSMMITISNQAPQAPTVVTNAASNIVTTTATLNGTVTANNATTTCSFDWGLTTTYGNNAAATPATVNGYTPTPVLANIIGLVVGSTYHFRCKGTNSVGTSYGADMTFIAGCQPLVSAGTITGPASVCINATGQGYSIATVTGATGYTWTVPSGANITAGQNTTSITVTFGSTSGNVSVFATNTCSTSSTSTYAVSVVPPPVPSITGPATFCTNGGLATYTTEVGMTSYNWTVSSGGVISSGAGSAQISVIWNTAGAQTVSVNYTSGAGCSASNPTVYNVTVTAGPDPAGSITGTSVLCAGTTGVSYSTPAIANALTYIWYLPSGATIASGMNTNSITVDFSASAISGEVTVLGNNACGNGTVSPPLPVTVNPIPPTPVVIVVGPSLQSDAPNGNQWYYSDTQAGAGAPINGATGQVYTPTQVGYFWTVVTLNGCISAPSNRVHVFVIGVDEITAGNLSIYPIPNDGAFNVILTSPVKDVFRITVYNPLGLPVYESGEIIVNGTFEQRIDLGPVSGGLYSVVILNSKTKVVKKILIRN
ncbi:MAG: hypothetical protein NTU98_10115 [Bacteroidetes bacterium]|nr:hypothetical protein [Bacteroidota bacterium]